MTSAPINDSELLSLPTLPQLGQFNRIPSELATELEREVALYPAPAQEAQATESGETETPAEVFLNIFRVDLETLSN